jgi:DNA-binding CsgD family transcriptional regulator
MSRSLVAYIARVLLGRDAELAEIADVLHRAREGDGGGMLIIGEPGIGKTALLGGARERADGMLVSATAGYESEADLPFAALAGLAEPLLDRLDRLPAPQAHALEVALALAQPRTGGDRLAAFAGFARLVAIGASESPVLLMVDDVQWLDSPSAECLAYLARRLPGSSVALVATARDRSALTVLGDAVDRRLTVAGLDRDSARAVIRSFAGELARDTEDELLDAALGNPLALRELPTSLSERQRRGEERVEPALEPGTTLWRALEARITALAPGARQAALVAAASMDGATAAIEGACDELELGREPLELCERAGVLEISSERATFTHPLLRGVALRLPPAADRRRAHQALARHSEPDAAAWHLAAAATGPDEEVAAALEHAGYRAASRGAHGAAADALERAAAASTDPDGRAQRLLTAALAAGLGGAYPRAAAMLEPVGTVEDPVMRARIRHLLSMLTLAGAVRDPSENRALLLAGAREVEPHDRQLAATMLADAGVSAVVAGRCDAALEAAAAAQAALPRDATDPVRCQVHSIHGMALVLRGHAREGSRELERAAALLDSVDPVSPGAQSISLALHGRVATGHERSLRDGMLRLIARGRDAGTVGMLPYYLLVAADAAFRLGAWERAAVEADEAVVIAEDSGSLGPLSFALAVRGRHRAARGDEAAARADLGRAAEMARERGIGGTGVWAQGALGFLELSAGPVSAAITALEDAREMAAEAALEDHLLIPWAADLVEAYVRAGREEEANRSADELAAISEPNETALARAMKERCLGLARSDGDRFEAALELHAGAGQPFEHARTLLAYGLWLHRSRRRRDARDRLGAALETFERLGARPWAGLARAELRAAGASPREPDAEPDTLTAQEARIARVVASGATNKEVAAELFLSPKTIEFHLSSIYRKLGIRSRTELAGLVAERTGDFPGDEAPGRA